MTRRRQRVRPNLARSLRPSGLGQLWVADILRSIGRGLRLPRRRRRRPEGRQTRSAGSIQRMFRLADEAAPP